MKKSTIPELKEILMRGITLDKSQPYHANDSNINTIADSIPLIEKMCGVVVSDAQKKSLDAWVDKLKSKYLIGIRG